QGDGGILAISGERKLSVRSRGIHEIHYQIGRVPANQINHLVSQTSGEFQNPSFRNSHFTQENIARIATERQTIQFKDKFKPNFSTFDFTKHLAAKSPDGTAIHGLFFLEASEHVPKKVKKTATSPDEPAEETKDEDQRNPDSYDPDDYTDERAPTATQRFILITDLGMIVKENAEESQDVFISSIKTGLPLAGVTIEILGKNGVPLVSALTQTDGRVHFPSLGRPTNEKKPVAFIARLGTDLAFMPYAREDRLLNFSRFNIGGVESRSNSELDAFVFTERGIYRPGDEIHVGILIKQRDWAGKLDGLPIETEVTDAKGTSVQIRKIALPSMGFADLSYQTTSQPPSGDYTISAYLIRNGKRDVLLGDTTVIVKDFLPDRMKIVSTLTQNGTALSTQLKSGWFTPQDVHADISLQNLYATPATDRRIKAHFTISAATFHFDEFKDFHFFDRLSDPKKENLNQEIDLGELKTNDQGTTSFALNLERFANANFHMHFFAEGFEADGGRSVSSHQSLLVSPMPYLIGSKPDANLDYLKVGSTHSIEWIAIDPTLKKIAIENLQCRLIELTHTSILSKADNGNYVYESVLREKPLRTEPLTITADGLKYPLPTDLPGNYSLELFEKDDGPRVSKVTFSVVGNGAISRSLDKNAELQIKLANTSFNKGSTPQMPCCSLRNRTWIRLLERF
ncbi:MAG: MG2 domain-containing protein, partial [Verrucomicrobia bacterium]|nr:MG2 domain-containing protein [Verrucomicrobiota bacterium]